MKRIVIATLFWIAVLIGLFVIAVTSTKEKPFGTTIALGCNSAAWGC